MTKTIIESFKYKHLTLENGSVCPACLQKINLTRRPFSREYAQCLAKLYRGGQDKFQHFKDFRPHDNFNDYNKIKHWGLIEPQENSDPKKAGAGYWRLTYKGIEFIHGKTTIPDAVYIFNDSRINVSDDTIKEVKFRDVYDGDFKEFDIQEIRTAPGQAGLFDYFISNEKMAK